MRVLSPVRPVLLLCLVGAPSARAEPKPAPKWPGATHSRLASVTQQTYDLDLQFDGKGEKDTELSLVFAGKSPKDHYRLDLFPASCRLTKVRAGRSSRIAHREGTFPPQGKHRLLLRRHDGWLSVVLDDEILIHALDGDLGPGEVLLVDHARAPRVTGLRVQPIEPIHFSDDFMRTAEEPDPWETVQGDWQLRPVARPELDYRITRRPQPERSPNYFSYEAISKGRSIALAGHPFWSDYTFAAAVKAEDRGLSADNTLGLIFCWRDQANHFLLRWHFAAKFLSRSQLELIRVRDGARETVARAELPAQTDQWYLVQTQFLGTRVRVFVDRRQVIDIHDPHAFGGRVGLYNEGPGKAFFDDVEVKSTDRFKFNEADGSPDERFVTRTSLRAGTLQLFGSATWDHYLVEARARRSRKTRSVGLAARFVGSAGHLLLKWDSPNRKRPGWLSLIRVADGESTVIARCEEPFLEDRAYTLRLHLEEAGVAKAYIDGELKLRGHDPAPGPGRAALYSAGPGANFQFPTIAFSEDRVIEEPVPNQIYVNDPYMQGWTNPRWVWLPEGKTQPEDLKEPSPVLWHKGDFYSGFRLRILAAAPGSIHFGLANKELGAAYALHVERPDSKTIGLKLTRKGDLVGQASLGASDCTQVENPEKDGPKLPQIKLHREGHYIWIEAGKEEVLQFRDPEPLGGSRAALHRPSGKGLNSEHVVVERHNVVDEYFDAAPRDWLKLGDWDITNRFQCDPRWSHYSGCARQVASLWNKYEYDGDLTVEYHAGMRHGRAYYRPGDINLTICGDGQTLSSGYSFIITAWDEGWNGRYSRILRGDKVVAETDVELAPRVRESAAKRHFQGLWNPAGRDIHGAWHYVKVRKIGNRLECYFENKLVMSYEDPEPLQGKRIALWTQDNEIVLAKMKISYSGQRRVPAHLAPPIDIPRLSEGLPEVQVSAAGLASHAWDFECGLEGWQSIDEHGAVLALDETDPAPDGRASLRLVNANGGGTFGVKVPFGSIDLLRCSEFSFDYKVTPETRANFYFTVASKQYFLEFTGSSRSDEQFRRIGKVEHVEADGKWRRASIPIAKALRQLMPAADTAVATGLTIGQLEEGYLRAGFEGNPFGATYWLDNVRFVSASRSSTVDLQWRLHGPDGREIGDAGKYRYRYVVDRQPTTEPETEERKAEAALNAAGLAEGRHYFHLKARRPDGAWTATLHYPFDIRAKPPTVVAVSPSPDTPWGGEPIRARFREDALVTLLPSQLAVMVNDRTLPAVELLRRHFDWSTQTLSLDLNHFPAPKDGTIRVAIRHAGKLVPVQLGPETTAGLSAERGRKLSLAEWTYRYERSADHRPPTQIEIPEAGHLRLDFENGLPRPCVSRTGIVRVDDATAASGRRSLQVFNPSVNGTMEVDLRPRTGSTFDLGRFPVLALDYCIPSAIQTDLAVLSRSLLRYARFTDRDTYHKRHTQIGGIQADGRWHHAEVGLRRVLDAHDYHPEAHLVSAIRFGDWGFSGNGPRVSYHLDNVQLVPVVSATAGGGLTFRASDVGGVKGFSFHWNDSATDVPDTKIDAPPGKRVFRRLPEGTRYLHVRACDHAGNWSEPRSFRFLIDNAPPSLREVHVTDKAMEFGAGDATAGIDPESLRVKLDGKVLALEEVVTSWSARAGTASKPADTPDQADAEPVYPVQPETFEWYWPLARGHTDRPVPDGTDVRFELQPVRDFAGNETRGKALAWKVDYAADKNPPPAPDIKLLVPAASAPQGGLLKAPVFETFTSSLGEWQPFSEVGGGMPTRVWDEERKDYVLAVTSLARGDMGARALETDYDASQFPILSFDYKIPKKGYAFSFHLIAYVNGQWRALELYRVLRSWRTNPRLRRVATVVRNGRWNTLTINLHELLQEDDPASEKYIVERLAVVDWYVARVPTGSVYYLDNFAVLPQGNSSPEFEFHSYDSAGIKAFSYEITRTPGAVPDEEPEGSATKAKFSGLMPGQWYFHVRAQDGAGNWGATSSMPYTVVGVLPDGHRLRMFGVQGAWSQIRPLLRLLPQYSINGLVTDAIGKESLINYRRAKAAPLLEFPLAGLASTEKRPELKPTGPDDKPLPPSSRLTVCPSDEAYLQERLEHLREKLRTTEATGVLLTGAQFPWDFLSAKTDVSPSCFNESCLNRFQNETKIRVQGSTTAEKTQWILTKKGKEWAAWKCSVVSRMVHEARKAIDEERPGTLLGLVVCPWQADEHGGAIRSLAGQDLVELAKHVDFLAPMTLHAACGKKPDWPAQHCRYLKSQLRKAKLSTWVWPLIQAGRLASEPKIGPEELAEAIARSLEAEADGALVWVGNRSRLDSGQLAALKAIYGEYRRVGCPAGDLEAEAPKAVARAEQALKDGKPEQALKSLRQFLDREPHSSAAWALRGEALAQLGQDQQAFSAIRRSIFENPRNSKSWDLLGWLLKRAQQYGEAIEALNEALKLNPKLAVASYRLAATYILQGKASSGFKPLERACELDPGLKKVWPKDPEFEPVWKDQWFGRLGAWEHDK